MIVDDRTAEGASEVDGEAISREYDEKRFQLDSLLAEAHHILGTALASTDIKLHGIESRRKTLASLIEKARREKCATPFSVFSDIVGVRIVCLFKDDLDAIAEIVTRHLTVLKKDDKRAEAESALGYMSIHFDCTLPADFRGPRYDSIKDLKFEVQLRTLCMHSWSSVSHYLDYKGEWDVPKDLRLALSALAGLFFVADNEFQRFYRARLASLSKSAQELANDPTTDQELNFDTLSAYLIEKFPDRERGSATTRSDLVRQAIDAGYDTIAKVRAAVEDQLTAVLKEDARRDSPYVDAGMVRVALSKASPKFKAVLDEDFAKRRRENRS